MHGRHILIAAGLAVATSGALALEGDPVAARDKVSMCMGCHGIPGYRTTFPDVYSVPKLGGQYPEYIVRALQAYKDGERSHPTMQAIAQALSEQDMADLAAYYGIRKEAAQ
jgi:cytochrome c553